MMGVYFPNMRMPSCGECPFLRSCGLGYGIPAGGVDKDCPAVFVPVPHGDLVDRDEARARWLGGENDVLPGSRVFIPRED